jgi:hypothetical protein
MDDNFANFDAPEGATPPGRRSGLPFELNLMTVATGVLVFALIAIFYLFFLAPQPAPDATLEPATPTALALGSPMATAAGTAVAPVLGSAVAATPLAGALGTPSAMVPLGTPAMPGPGTPTTMGLPPAGTPTAGPVGMLAVGQFVQVGNTDGLGIRYRYGAGTDMLTIRIIMDGEVLKVLGGPESNEGISWWRLQDNLGNVGWAAQEYLLPTAAPASWSPPAASQTFEAGSGGALEEATATP